MKEAGDPGDDETIKEQRDAHKRERSSESKEEN